MLALIGENDIRAWTPTREKKRAGKAPNSKLQAPENIQTATSNQKTPSDSARFVIGA
jgi:hypothetical protein